MSMTSTRITILRIVVFPFSAAYDSEDGVVAGLRIDALLIVFRRSSPPIDASIHVASRRRRREYVDDDGTKRQDLNRKIDNNKEVPLIAILNRGTVASKQINKFMCVYLIANEPPASST